MNKLCILLLAFCVIFTGCDTLPLKNIGFCYSDENGRQYCGEIGLSEGKTEQENSIVLEETPEEDGAEPKILYTFTEEEVRVLASQLGDMTAPESDAASVSSSESDAPPEYMKPGLTDFRRCKIYLRDRLNE